MADILNRFDICSKISESTKNRIKWLNVFNDCHNRKNVLFCTSDDRIFGFGANGWGILGFGHELNVEEPEEVVKLSNQKVNQLFFGNDFALALTQDHVVFGWGANYCGQLGTGNTCEVDDRSEPMRFKFFDNKRVKQITCGYFHSLVLTEDHHVFGWGWNAHGQVGCGQRAESVPEITRLEGLEGMGVTSIHCSYNSSLALTREGAVFGWGDNSSHQLGLRDEHYSQPMSILGAQHVRAVTCSLTNTYFLTNEGKVLFCGEFESHARSQPVITWQETPKHVEMSRKEGESAPKRVRGDHRFLSLDFLDGKTTAIGSGDWVHALKGNRISKTKYKSLFDFFSIKYQLSHKCVLLKKENRVMKVMAKAFNNPKNSDLRFKLKKKNLQEQSVIFAHKWFLEENSEYFRRMFANKWAEEKSNEIEITGYSFEAYFEYLKWIYTNSVDTQDMEVLMEMLGISEVHLDQEFKDKCVSHTKALTDLKNVCSVYCFAVELRAKELEEFCYQLMSSNIRSIITGEDYRLMDSSVAKHFFTQYFLKN